MANIYDKCKQLEAENERLQHLCNDKHASMWMLQAEINTLAKDAKRYQWLRDRSVPPHNFYISVPEEFKDIRYVSQDVDAYIDAAMKGNKP